MTKKSWYVKEYKVEDKDKIFQLRRDVYGEPFDPDGWEWKFENSKIFLAVNEKGNVVGIRPTIIMKLKYHDHIVNAGMNVDVMTHPEYRRRGIFSTLVEKSQQEFVNSDVEFIYTFPNQFSFPGYAKIKWPKICSIPLLVKPKNAKNLVDMRLKNKLLSSILMPFLSFGIKLFFRKTQFNYYSYSMLKINKFDRRFDVLWDEISSKFKISIIRDSEFLNWRYVERPGYEYDIFAAFKNDKLVGYVITRSDELFGINLGIIVDILALDDLSACYLIENAFENLKNVDVVGCLMLEHQPYFNDLKKLGFRKIPKRYSPKEFYFVGNDVDELKLFGEYSENNWYITFGDIDIA